MSASAHNGRPIRVSGRQLSGGEFNRSTQHPSLERTDCWCRSNFSIKSQDIRHRSRSFERLRRYPSILAALSALPARCLQLRHEPCPCMSLHMHVLRRPVKFHRGRPVTATLAGAAVRDPERHVTTVNSALRKAYSITSSAVASSDCGTVRQSALAVLRLRTRSNFVGCWTGRSAGLAPLRIWPT